MASFKDQLKSKQWTRDAYMISTDPKLVPIPRLIEVFDSKELHWARSMPVAEMQLMLDNSLIFGLYSTFNTESDRSIANNNNVGTLTGFARLVTDFTTFAYLTDVWIDPASQGKGLGTWLVSCVDELLNTMPHLRGLLLLSNSWKQSVPFYEKIMGMKLVGNKEGEGLAVMNKVFKGSPHYGNPDW